MFLVRKKTHLQRTVRDFALHKEINLKEVEREAKREEARTEGDRTVREADGQGDVGRNRVDQEFCEPTN